jgi:hypothetical protein
MTRIAISDESGIQTGNKCYGIGAFAMPAELYADLDRCLRHILKARNITHELKWSDTPSRPHIEAACEGIELLLASGARFYSIITEKATFRNWQKDKEEAFYQTYQMLASHVAKSGDDPFELRIDQRSDSYSKRTEVVQIITNYATAKRQGTADLLGVTMIDSKTNVILQMTDMLIGAITADTHKYLSDDRAHSVAKAELVRRFAAFLGWHRLCYDTYPNPDFNIWHFPTEFRARPGTRAILPVSIRISA